jgi:hypothetical protein
MGKNHHSLLTQRVLSVDGAVLGPHVGEVLHLLQDELDGLNLLVWRVVVAGQEALDGGAETGTDGLTSDRPARSAWR